MVIAGVDLISPEELAGLVAGEMALALGVKEVLLTEPQGQRIAAVVLAVGQLDLQAVLAS